MFLHGKPDPRSRSFNLLIAPPTLQSTTQQPAALKVEYKTPLYKAEPLPSTNLSPGAHAFHFIPK